MRHKQVGDTWVLRIATGEEITSTIMAFAAERRIEAAGVTAIGAAYDAVLGYFDRSTGEYERRTFSEEMEILSLAGNIAIKEGRPFTHLHVVLGRRDCTTVGGHLFEAKAGATCEVMVRPLAGDLHRAKDEVTGLFLLDL